jgi:hypothetical protein
MRGEWAAACVLLLCPPAAAREVAWPIDFHSGKTVARTLYRVGETAEGRIDGADTVALVDALGREYARGPGPGYRIRIAAYHTDWSHAVGFRDGREVGRQPFLVAAPRGRRDLDDYLVLVWHAPGTEAEARALWRMGAVGAVGKFWHQGHAACLKTQTYWYHHNLESKSCLTRYHALRRAFYRMRADYAAHRGEPTKYAVRKPCLNDPETFRRLDEEQLVRKIVTCPTRDLGTLLFYEIADEGSISKLNAPMDFCFGPHCLREMRTWLQEQYDDLAALNRSWGTTFKTWDAVAPDTTFQAMKRADGNYASWCDHRAFMDRTLAVFLSKTAARVRRLSGGLEPAYFGTEMPSPFGGYDWYRLGRTVRLHEAYDIGDSVECLRSFAPPRARIFRTFSGSGAGVEHANWRYLFHDHTGLILWGPGGRVVRDGRLTKRAQEVAPHLFELRSGIGKLIIDADRVNDPVALHYSQQSLRVGWMVDAVRGSNKNVPWHTRRENYEWFHQRSNGTRGAAIRLIEDNHLQFRFVATPEIEADALARQGFKLLLLHHSFAVGRKEADALRAFVRAGGVVVADAQVGTFDGHGTPVKTGVLDDLFGVERIPRRHAPVRDEQVAVRLDAAAAAKLGLDLRGLDLRSLAAFDGVRAKDGMVLGKHDGTPVVVARAHGKGLAVYLNLSLAPYLLWRLDVDHPEKSAGLRGLVGALAARAGVRPACPVALKDGGGPAPCTEVFRYRSGAVEYVAAIRNYQVRGLALGEGLVVRSTGRSKNAARIRKPLPVTVRLSRRGHVYDVRARTWLGETDRVDTTLDPFLPALYAVLPVRPRRLKARAAFDRRTGRVALTAELIPAADTHVFHVELADPEGTRRLHLLRNHPAPAGKLKTTVFLGTNAAPGRWRFTVRDAATGIATRLPLVIGPRETP